MFPRLITVDAINGQYNWRMRNLYRILLLTVWPASGLLAQEPSVAGKQAGSGQQMGERDKAKEDQVAKLFETIRADSKIPPLTRIGHRDSLEQQVCTLALTGKPPKYVVSAKISALYKTTEPGSPSPELKVVASFNDLHSKNNWSITRYSVAVWNLSNRGNGEMTYWVAVQLYWSGLTEFFDSHFTDDIYSHNEWKKHVAPECRGK
jgi:hypothetical protein